MINKAIDFVNNRLKRHKIKFKSSNSMEILKINKHRRQIIIATVNDDKIELFWQEETVLNALEVRSDQNGEKIAYNF